MLVSVGGAKGVVSILEANSVVCLLETLKPMIACFEG